MHIVKLTEFHEIHQRAHTIVITLLVVAYIFKFAFPRPGEFPNFAHYKEHGKAKGCDFN